MGSWLKAVRQSSSRYLTGEAVTAVAAGSLEAVARLHGTSSRHPVELEAPAEMALPPAQLV